MKKLEELFSLNDQRASDEEIHDNILAGMDMKGGNFAILFCAIFIASLGLNTNSTAVIIGAMLISPLMGPIIGIGYGIGTHDFEIVKKAIRILGIEVLISLLTATLYFAITPLKEAGSEILSRTTPTIWDVMIAFIGGLAGIIGATRKEKTNVIPGVAIATALMPPLCTAGFGIARMRMDIFLGAFYLFVINSVFISLSTFVITKVLKLPLKVYIDKLIEKKMKRSILLIVIVTIIPSIYIGYGIVRDSVLQNSIDSFIRNEFKFSSSRVIGNYYNEKEKNLEVVILGNPISQADKTEIEKNMKKYGLSGIELSLNQSVSPEKSKEELERLKSSMLEEVNKQENLWFNTQADKIKKLEEEIAKAKVEGLDSKSLKKEINTVFPEIESFSVSNSEIVNKQGEVKKILVCIVRSNPEMDQREYEKLKEWLKVRIGIEEIYIFKEDHMFKVDANNLF